MRQLLKDFDRSLSDATSARDTEDHRGELAWHATSADVVSEAAEGVLHRVIVQIHVRASNEERRLELLLKQEFADSTEEIMSTGDASISAEGD